ncbi:hypothetical protein OJ252_2704 [Cryptosporidium canis]|uniref:Uncharacterized protein n=1 Tax=Cryptosporidium canis TaxID=195482 RepID=A0ABQ8P4T9_9CRYT|nr:hypothetical protein OJ252_2704 [Cryptosporidium canis]
MSEFVVVGSSLLDERFMRFLKDEAGTKKVNKMNALVVDVREFKFNVSDKAQEIGSNIKELVVPKCEMRENIDIPLDPILTFADSFGIVSPGKLFGHVLQFLRSDSRMSDHKNEQMLILVSGSYFSMHLSLLIKYTPCSTAAGQLIQSELLRQAYEDVLSLVTCIRDTVVKEAEIHDLSELDFSQIVQRGREDSCKHRKILNYSSKSCNLESNTYYLERYPNQYRDIIFRIKSLALSSSSNSTIDLFVNGQVACVKIVSL